MTYLPTTISQKQKSGCRYRGQQLAILKPTHRASPSQGMSTQQEHRALSQTEALTFGRSGTESLISSNHIPQKRVSGCCLHCSTLIKLQHDSKVRAWGLLYKTEGKDSVPNTHESYELPLGKNQGLMAQGYSVLATEPGDKHYSKRFKVRHNYKYPRTHLLGQCLPDSKHPKDKLWPKTYCFMLIHFQVFIWSYKLVLL